MTSFDISRSRQERMLSLVAILCFFGKHFLALAENMNGAPGQYKIANGLSHTQFNTDYKAEFFEVYSPTIRTRYSEVFWAGMPPIPIPPEIVERFANNKTMAVVGYEVDQVQVQTRLDENGNSKQVETSVPITHTYNHHYCSWLVNSKKARLRKIKASEEMLRSGLTHGSEDHWVTELKYTAEEAENMDPKVQFFSEGNGREFRMSYHGYPRGYAQLIESPDTFRLVPMLIDTFNRDEPGPAYRPGPMPRSSQVPPSAGYSGLLECPCSDRIQKTWNMTYSLKATICDEPVQSQKECFETAPQLVGSSLFRRLVIHNASLPTGCSLVQFKDGTTDVYWNSESVEASLEADDNRIDPFVASKNDMVAFAAGQVNVTVAVQQPSAGNGNGLSDVDVDDDDAVIIKIVGPVDKWFGVGFGSATMCNHMESDQCPDGGPYAIIVKGDHVEERQLGYHEAGVVLSNTTSTSSSHLKIHRNQVVGGNRTVVLTRSRHGSSFSFDPVLAANLPIITARGCSMEFAQHCGHGPAQLNFLETEKQTQICRAGVQGTIQGRKFYEEGRCPSFPRGSLISKDYINPTCKVKTYQGGLFCCNHGQFLLDKDQEIPWQDQYLEYQLKFRFYFEEYRPPTKPSEAGLQVSESMQQPASHQNLVRLTWATEGNAGEYDIEQCPPGTPTSQCVKTITARFQIKDMLHDCDTHRDASWCTGIGSRDPSKTEGVQIIYAGPHCHAPACLSMELYHANTGQLLCRVEPIYGKSKDKIFDEDGYLALPPCLFGAPSEGLPPPVLLPLDAELISIKRNNNTLPHTGEMALWQMRGVVVPKQSSNSDKGGFSPEAESLEIEPALRRRREGV